MVDRCNGAYLSCSAEGAAAWRFPSARLLIFSRVPEAGASKTRLIPLLGPEGAAQFQARMTRRTVAMAVEAQLAPVELWGEPQGDHPFFTELSASHPIAHCSQVSGDLGRRMDQALTVALSGAEMALLIGTDCPAMGPAHWGACLEALAAGQDAVLLPAEDGGYVAVGLRRPAPWLFADLPWGSADVIHHTRERLRAHGWSWSEPALLWDVDDARDWRRLEREFPELSRSAS